MAMLEVLAPELQVGDVVSYRGQRVRVVAEPVVGKHSVYRVGVEPLSPMNVGFDYNEKVTVEREP